MTKALVLGGTASGCGKSSVALGLMRALARRGLCVQPFKSGPDFIDPGLHAAACRRPSHNLDTWMLPAPAVRALFARHARGADLALVEGAMGLFDGAGGRSEEGSAAHLAKVLGLPAVLVADARSLSRSVAALVSGYARFDPELPLAGALLNNAGSPRHARLLAQAMSLVPEVPLLGCLPKSRDIALPSRHLGLVTAGDAQDLEAALDALAGWVEQGMDVPALLERLPEIALPAPEDGPAPAPRTRIGIARDRAFCFLYAENLRLLAAAGAELVFFSPLADAGLPPGLDGLILPGGYPELAAQELTANATLRAAVRAFCASGRPVWAECGGFMYLLERLVDLEGREHPMCGALPGCARMRPGRAALGYRQARTLAPGPLGPAGTLLRGHEFHYSEAGGTPGPAAFALADADGGEGLDGMAPGNVLGGYFHAHLGSNPEAAGNFVAACAAARAGRGGGARAGA